MSGKTKMIPTRPGELLELFLVGWTMADWLVPKGTRGLGCSRQSTPCGIGPYEWAN